MHRGQVDIGDQSISGDLACLFIQPRPHSAKALVGAIAATSPGGISARLSVRVIWERESTIRTAVFGVPDGQLIGRQGTSQAIGASENGEFEWADDTLKRPRDTPQGSVGLAIDFVSHRRHRLENRYAAGERGA